VGRLKPTVDQENAIRRIVNETSGGVLQASDLGTGKTLMAVEAALRFAGDGVIVISAPLHTFYGWFDTVFGQTNGTIQIKKVDNKTKRGKNNLEALQWATPGWYFVGREFFRLQDWSNIEIDLMVHDECHSLQNRKSKGFKTARKVNARMTIAQSATWFGSSFEGAWAVLRVLWPDEDNPGQIADRSYHRWVNNWCKTEYDHFAENNRHIVGELHPGELARTVPCYINLRNTATEEPEIVPIYVDLTSRQQAMYNQMERDGVAWLDDNPMVAELPITVRMRLRQLTLGEASVNSDGEVHFVPECRSSKLDALVGLLDDLVGEQIVVATDSAKFARLVADRVGGFAWTGDKSQEERETAKKIFMAGKLRVIVATQAAISEGTDGLQRACRVLVELSQSDSPIMNQQMVGRLNRTGQQGSVIVYRLMARTSLYDPQAATLSGKELKMRASMLKGNTHNGSEK
jgi:hypothetical protein